MNGLGGKRGEAILGCFRRLVERASGWCFLSISGGLRQYYHQALGYDFVSQECERGGYIVRLREKGGREGLG